MWSYFSYSHAAEPADSTLSRTSTRELDLPDLASQAFLDDTGKPATLPEMGNGGEESKMRVLLGLLKK
jgi:hypothetical protein